MSFLYKALVAKTDKVERDTQVKFIYISTGVGGLTLEMESEIEVEKVAGTDVSKIGKIKGVKI